MCNFELFFDLQTCDVLLFASVKYPLMFTHCHLELLTDVQSCDVLPFASVDYSLMCSKVTL